MDIVEYEKRMAEIDESINKCNEELDSLHEKRNQFWQEQMRLKKAFNLEKLKGLNLVEGNVVIGVSKMRDYHFTMIKAYTILHNGGINHIKTIRHIYRCDDFDYSYKTTQENINLEKILKMARYRNVCYLLRILRLQHRLYISIRH